MSQSYMVCLSFTVVTHDDRVSRTPWISCLCEGGPGGGCEVSTEPALCGEPVGRTNMIIDWKRKLHADPGTA
jgi:hypothetical protein